ncbi:UvrD-helicase domain-containing protein [Neobacillus sp.]|uniref:UvrD-helicase domain-containing protein n=1 Tax=Neobacillus sp. TaxID=2675273 RepID=UPI0028A26BEF|nr:UvrD-helicase domain-containing protein [Neobacillus sp.]
MTHTNVAIDEIKSKLGPKADILFKYPNFFGTFQQFVDKFLAIPYYAMVTKSRAVTMDERYYEEKMNKQVMSNIRGVKAQTLKNTRYFLLGNKLDPSKVRIQLEEGRRLLTLGLNGRKIEVNRPRRGIAKNFSMKEKEDIIDFLDRLKQKALLDGVLCYDDAYFLANRYLEKYGQLLKDLFIHRFKFVFVDEAQDTYSHQSAILESIFDDRVVVQKFGDTHQSIFGNKGADEENSWTPIDGNCLKINDSQRFGVRIAQKLRRICADENHELYGSNTVPSLKPHILLFNQSNSTHVLERFAELVYKNGLHMADESGKIGSFKAIGWRGNRTDNVTEKPCLNTYWPSYNKKASEIESTYHNNLCSYIKKTLRNVEVQHCSKVYYDSIINAIIRFLYLADVRDTTSGRERHFHRSSLLKYLKKNHKDEYFQMQKLISEWVLKIHSHVDVYNNEVLEALKNFLTIDLKRIWPQINLIRLTHFLESSDEAVGQEQEVTTVGNQYISSQYPEIKIDINTVHAVKGETHRATLYLETFNYERDLKKLLPFLKTRKHYQEFFEDRDIVYSYQQAQSVCNSIARHFRKTVLKEHICCIKELTRYRRTLMEEEICPFAIAYVYWRLRLQGFKKYEYVDNWGTTPFFKESAQDYGYPVYSYKFKEWLRELQEENVVLTDNISSSRNTYMWVLNHLIKELVIAEFYRCLEYGLNWRDNHNKNYTINSIYSLKYMPKLLIYKDSNQYYCIKEAKIELNELKKEMTKITCINSNLKINRNRKTIRTEYDKEQVYKTRKFPIL